ncbi:MAG: hypothetical protein ACD_20C00390G0002 [uncultured bacterium]|nr:MAG: hypothetical protein ACD_20C00390G0002 [uncultured bacterium]
MVKLINHSEPGFKGSFIVKPVSKDEFESKTGHLSGLEKAKINKTLFEIENIVKNRLPQDDTVEISLHDPVDKDLRFHGDVATMHLKYTPGEESKELKITNFTVKEFLDGVLTKDFGLNIFNRVADRYMEKAKPLYNWFKQ